MTAQILFDLFVFPGIAFTAVLGLLAGWVDRKVSARFQYRVGPLFQNFNDIFKLLGKETVLSSGSTGSSSGALAGFAVLSLAATSVGTALFFGRASGADLIVLMYLLMFYSVLIVLGGASPGNVFSSLGAGREVKLLLADELPFILACLVPVIRAGYRLDFGAILAYQDGHGMLVGSLSGAVPSSSPSWPSRPRWPCRPSIPRPRRSSCRVVHGVRRPLLAFWKLNSS
jgi:NADH-quinone oxidoreductase subunit H